MRSLLNPLLLLVALFTGALPLAASTLTPPDTIGPMWSAVAYSSNHFGFRFLDAQAQQHPQANQFISPISLFAALTMTAEGADGKTLQLMQEALALPDEFTLHNGLKSLAGYFTKPHKPYELAMANALWPAKGNPLRPEYLKTIQEYYLGAAAPLDFVRDPESSRQVINRWVATHTAGRIQELLAHGAVNASTAIVLTNAIFFKGKWKTAFDKAQTREALFYVPGAAPAQVPMMHMPPGNAQFAYADMGIYKALRLPYAGNEIDMTLLLPQPGRMDSLLGQLRDAGTYRLESQMRMVALDIMTPRFKFDIGGSVREVLEDLGLAPIFQSADLSRMFSQPQSLVISDVIHKGFVAVDESGTEAAAATAVVASRSISSPTTPPSFRADRPFVFLITHRTTGTVLFAGKVMDPS